MKARLTETYLSILFVLRHSFWARNMIIWMETYYKKKKKQVQGIIKVYIKCLTGIRFPVHYRSDKN